MPVTFELSHMSRPASALIGTASPGSRLVSAIACIGARPISFSVNMRRGLSALKMRQNSAHASLAAVPDTVGDADMARI